QAEDGRRDGHVTGVQTCALPIESSLPLLSIPPVTSTWLPLRSVAPWKPHRGSVPAEDHPWLAGSYKSALGTALPSPGSNPPVTKIGRASCRESAEVSVGEGGWKG